jgi:hypothetical protein
LVSLGLEAPVGPLSQRPLPLLMIAKGSAGLWFLRGVRDSKKNPQVCRPPIGSYRVRDNMFPEIENLSVRQNNLSWGRGGPKSDR